MQFLRANPPPPTGTQRRWLCSRAAGFFLALLFALPSLPVLCAAAEGAAIPAPFSGTASWYGRSAHGRVTASGRVFDRLDYAAAHRALPFGTVLRVHNFRNNKHVLVAICDRGPFGRGRVVDVSLQAAKELDFVSRGIVPVWCEVVSTPDGAVLDNRQRFYIQLFTACVKDEAERRARDAALYLNLATKVFRSPDDGPDSYVTCVGPWPVFFEAETLLEDLPAYYARAKVILGPLRGDTLPSAFIPGTVPEPSPAPVKKSRPTGKKRSGTR